MDKNIPMPEPRSSILEEFNIKELEVGDSILLATELRSRVQTALSRYKSRSGRAFTVRKVDDTNIRVWRIQ